MQRAIPRRRAIVALLAIVALGTAAPFAGTTHSAVKPVKQYYLCPPVC